MAGRTIMPSIGFKDPNCTCGQKECVCGDHAKVDKKKVLEKIKSVVKETRELQEHCTYDPWERRKVITTHVGVSQFMRTLKGPIGYVKFPSGLIPSPYFFARYRGVYEWDDKKVIVVETAQRRYEVIELPADEPVLPRDPTASR